MPEFIVVSDEEPATEIHPAIVSAENADEAIDKFLRQIYAKENVFREDVLDRCVNMSFAERFFIVTDKEKRDFENGCLKVDLAAVKERVTTYFSMNPAVGEKYFAYLQGGDESVLDDEVFEVIAASDTSGIAALKIADLSHV